MTNIPIQCQSCGATGEVLRVTANLQCRCGSTDLDLWDGESWAFKTAADDPDDYKDSEWWAATHPEGEDDDSASGSRRFEERRKKESAAKGPGTGWGQSRPDNASNWDEYAGPTPGANPLIQKKLDSDDDHVCPICHGTGKTMLGGGSYGEGVCRNCHGTGKAVYISENDTPSLDAHMPQGGSPLGAGANNGHYSSQAPVVVPGVTGSKVVTASQSDKIMKMAATIVENNSGLTTVEAFELARRAVASFPEDDA